ncbi:MAG TPA: GGDEF domain-containing protein [Candidatus Polarisedimenticolia bacterium]|nr:GGDEF domain-containing protein [Candidatus Polarisedimenticolia bacterium]
MSQKPLDKTIAMYRDKLDSGALRKRQASLVVLQGTEIGRDFRLKRARTILGRDPESDIRLLDDLASREHARIDLEWDEEQDAPVYVLVDLGSTNHTFLNSRRSETAELKDGDKIQIGETVLKFVLLDAIEARFHEEVRHRISYDRLTGLLTKESLYLAFENELKRCARYRLPLAVLMMDLDRFKRVNDKHGHQMGSHVLTEVGRLIRESIRMADVSARYGGEEFVSYLSETDAVGAYQAAERIRRAIEQEAFTLDDLTVQVTISIGVASFPDHGRDIKSLVARADRALYRAKEEGRNRICVETRV